MAVSARRWLCRSCAFVYDPAVGDPDGGIAPGTPFEAIPDGWSCPVCGARKSDFAPLLSGAATALPEAADR